MVSKLVGLISILIFNTVCNARKISASEDENEDTAGTSERPKFLHFKHFYNPFMKGRKFAAIGNQLVGEKKFTKALKFYKKAIRRKPSKASYYGLRGVCYLEIGDDIAALSDFVTALSKAKKHGTEESLRTILRADKFFELGKRLFNAWKFEEALWCYTEAINRKPNEATYYGSRGFCYSRNRDWDKAIADYEKGLFLDPDNKFCETHLAEALFESGRVRDKPAASTQELAVADPS